MILLVRHALAVPRSRWDRDDARRPLVPRGERQAGALVELLQPFEIERVVSSPATRCRDTVVPLARVRGLPCKTSKSLREGRGDDALDLLLDTIGNVVLCTHGDVVEAVLTGLRGLGWPIPPRPPLAKGSTWALSMERCDYLRSPA